MRVIWHGQVVHFLGELKNRGALNHRLARVHTGFATIVVRMRDLTVKP